MPNLLAETENAIKESNHTPEDIIFIGSVASNHRCSWEEFQELANFDYDSGYGSQHIASDLIIEFSDGGRLFRHEYDGSEYWKIIAPFVLPLETKPIKSLGGAECRWSTLEQLNEN